jgi:hypothetical protein
MGGLRPTAWSVERTALAVAALVWCAALGVLAARLLAAEEAEARGPTVLRTENGVIETGVVETVTVDGAVRRVIHWRTRTGTITQRVRGPVRLRTIQGDSVLVAGLTAPVVHTVRTPGSVVTLPGETVQNTVTEVNTVTETVQNTVTEVNTVTETVQNTVTETVTVTAPGPAP